MRSSAPKPSSKQYLSPNEAAARLNVSAKALRLYERRGLLKPARTAAGWRAYGPAEMARAAEISSMRALGLSLAQIERLLAVDAAELETALAAHQAALEVQARELAAAVEKVRGARGELAAGHRPAAGDLAALVQETNAAMVSFPLPWPWGGEQFELRELRPLNYLVGPLGSGKGQFALKLEAVLAGAKYVSEARLEPAGAKEALAKLEAQPELAERVRGWISGFAAQGLVDAATPWGEAGGELRDLLILLSWVEDLSHDHLIIDLPERGLGSALAGALGREMRARARPGRSLFLVTRSSAFLDLAAVGPGEAVFLFPANHNPPTRVLPTPGSAGYEAVAMCLAGAEVRARTEGVLVVRRAA